MSAGYTFTDLFYLTAIKLIYIKREKQIEKKIFPVCVPVDDDRACYFRMRWKRYEKS